MISALIYEKDGQVITILLKEVIKMEKDLFEKTIASKNVYNGKIINVSVDTVQLPNGKEAKREIVKHQGAVAVLAISPDNKVILVKQYRKPVDKMMIEIPAGKLEPSEKPEVCAIRELQEETGYIAKNVTKICTFYTSPGFSNEVIHLFRATHLEKGAAMPDDDEFVEFFEVTIEELRKLVESGEIIDAKTLVAIPYIQSELESNK